MGRFPSCAAKRRSACTLVKAAPTNAIMKVETNTREQGSAHDEDGIEKSMKKSRDFFRDMIGSPWGDYLKTEYGGFLSAVFSIFFLVLYFSKLLLFLHPRRGGKPD